MDEKIDVNSIIKKKKKVKKDKEERKALFFQRLVAFLIDMVIVAAISSILSSPFIDAKKEEKYSKDIFSVMDQYQKNEINVDEFYSRYSNIYYDYNRERGFTLLISIFIGIFYFVIYQVYRNGQTIGKKFMKIRVVSDEGELFYNQMIFRSFLADFIIFDIISFILMLFCPKSVYFTTVMIFQFIQYIMIIISIIMISRYKDGKSLHDKIAHTRVIREN